MAIVSSNPENSVNTNGPLPAQWRSILEQSGAIFDQSGVSNFGEIETEASLALSSDIITDLSHFGLIEVRGEDAQKFLSNLLTGDVKLVTSEKGIFTSWCDAKGRALATLWLFMYEGSYYILLPQAILESVLSGLKRYLLRVKVSLSDASSTLLRIGVSGPGAGTRMAGLFACEPARESGQIIRVRECALIRVHGVPHPRWIVIGPVAELSSLWSEFAHSFHAVGSNAWSLLDILSGLPSIFTETAGEFIPQMLDLEALGGLCFTKGCYPGQEVIARLHYRGQLKRRVYSAFVNCESLPVPGTPLYGAGLTESVGTVVSSARYPDGSVAMQVVVKIEEKDRPIHVANIEDHVLRFVD